MSGARPPGPTAAGRRSRRGTGRPRRRGASDTAPRTGRRSRPRAGGRGSWAAPPRRSRGRPAPRRELARRTQASIEGSTRRARGTQRAPSRAWRALALRVLRPLTRLVAPVLLALHRTRVACDEAGLLERGAIF